MKLDLAEARLLIQHIWNKKAFTSAYYNYNIFIEQF